MQTDGEELQAFEYLHLHLKIHQEMGMQKAPGNLNTLPKKLKPHADKQSDTREIKTSILEKAKTSSLVTCN